MSTNQPENVARKLVSAQIIYGIDVAAYATEMRMLPLNEDGTLDLEFLVAKAKHVYETEDLVFEPEWHSPSSFRVVSVTQEGRYLAEDIVIEANHCDVGMLLAIAISQAKTPRSHLIEAAKYLSIDDPENAIDSLIERLAIEAGYSKQIATA